MPTKTKPNKSAPKVGRKPFVESQVQVRFTASQLQALDRAIDGGQRNAWIRERCAEAAASPREWRSLLAARELLESLRGTAEPSEQPITVRFGAEQDAEVTEAAEAAEMIPSVWIREVAIAAALPEIYRDAARIVAAAKRLDLT